MDTMASNDHRLPRLVTSKDICRRDSLSSSRTRDSGYNSDLEVSLSPLDFLNSDQDILFAPLPPVPEIHITSKTTTRTGYSDLNKPIASHQPSVTSFAPCAPTSIPLLSPRNKRHKSHNAEIKYFTEKSFASQDDQIEKWMRDDNIPSRKRPQERVPSITSLSSTSSCEMYSSTDLSDAETDHGAGAEKNLHSKSTLKVIEMILRTVEVNLCYAAYKQCTSSGDVSRAHDNPAVWPQESGRKGSQSTGQKRKSRLEGSPPPEEDEEDGSNKRRRGSAATMDSSEIGVRFACPFYKHDPDRYRNRRTCPGPGWPTVHRMKEHLYRSHSQPIFCPICYSTFKSDKEQSNHVRLQQCQRMAPQQIEGIDRETVSMLRKRAMGSKLEEDKWREVYHVLFPDVPEGDIPSPFYDCDSPSEASRRFRRDLLRRVQNELFATARQASAPVEQQLLRQVAEIIRRCENELLHASPPSMAEGPPSDRRPSHSSIASGVSQPSSPHPPMPSSDLNRPCGPSYPLPTRGIEAPTAVSHLYHPSATPLDLRIQDTYDEEPGVGFAPVVWGNPAYGEFELGIDWDLVFSTASPVPLGESFVTLNVPAHT